jgi:hypothetical protein
MTMQALTRHARIILRSELLAAQARLSFALRRSVIAVCALLFAGLGLVFINMGLYAWLLPSWGPVWTPAGLGLINFGLAAIAVLVAALAKPGPELALAEEMRSLSTQEIETELRSMPFLGGLGGGDRGQMMQLLVPALSTIIGALAKRRKAQG